MVTGERVARRGVEVHPARDPTVLLDRQRQGADHAGGGPGQREQPPPGLVHRVQRRNAEDCACCEGVDAELLSRYCTASKAAISSDVAARVNVIPSARRLRLKPTQSGTTACTRRAVRARSAARSTSPYGASSRRALLVSEERLHPVVLSGHPSHRGNPPSSEGHLPDAFDVGTGRAPADALENLR